MIEIVKNGWILPSDDYLIRHKISGLDELEFTIPVDSDFYREIDEETQLCETTENIYYKVKAIDAGEDDVTFLCQIDLDEWKGEILGNWNLTKTVTEDGVTKNIKAHDPWKIGSRTLSTILGWIRPSTDWTYAGDLSKTVVRPLELPGPTRLDVAMAAEEAFGVSLRFDNREKVVTVIYPDDTPLSNSYAIRSVNLREIAYTGKSTDFCTRLYPEGKNGLTIADANNGVPYLDNNTWSDSVVCGYWKDERYTDPQSLMSAAEAELELRAMPARSWQCDIVDLNRIDPDTWVDMSVELLKRIRVIDDKKGISFTAYICEDEVYPYHPHQNTITISTVPGSIQSSIAALRTSVTSLNSTWWQRNNSSSVTMVENGVKESNGYTDKATGELADEPKLLTDLIAGNITAQDVSTKHLDAESIVAANAKIAEKLTAKDIEAETGKFHYLSTDALDAGYIRADRANINEAWIKDLLVQGKMIVQDGTVFYLDAVQVNASSITAGTLTVDRLMVRNADGEYYLIQPDEDGNPQMVKMDGNVIGDHTIAADKLIAHSITAEQMTIDNIVGTGGWINLAKGEFAYNNAETGHGIAWENGVLTINGCVFAKKINGEYIDVTSLFAQDITATENFQVDNDSYLLVQGTAGFMLRTKAEIDDLSGEGTTVPVAKIIVTSSANDFSDNGIMLQFAYANKTLRTAFLSLSDDGAVICAEGSSISFRGSGVHIESAATGDITLNGNSIADHIIERGTNGTYTYEKYASGTMKVWGSHAFSGVACTTAFGSGTGWYRTGTITPANYPVEFVELPVVHVYYRSTSGGTGAIVWSSNVGKTTRPANVMLCRPGSLESISGYLDIMAVGRWK